MKNILILGANGLVGSSFDYGIKLDRKEVVIWHILTIVILFNLSIVVIFFLLFVFGLLYFPIFVIRNIYRKIDEYICT